MADVYEREPDRIIADYNREMKHVEGYSGRGLLELIQNADDAGLYSSEPVEVLIELTESGVYIANTGEPFSRDGIGSLMLSDNSPKQFREECIGYKGLGFRSVLNWSSDVLIHSGHISVGFSERFAAAFLDDLCTENEEVERKVRRYDEQSGAYPIATLSTPRLLSPVEVDGSRLEEVYREGQRIQQEGYDTVICAPLCDEDGRERVRQEIDSLFAELMLFLQSVKELRIRGPERNDHWRIDRDGDRVEINNGDRLTSWETFEDEGKVPDEYRGSSQVKDKYEVRIAVPVELSEFVSPSNVFVFFPTKVSFPFPMLAHATFQVNESRNHLIESNANGFIAEQLAATMVDAAEACRSVDDPWRALKTVSSTGQVGTTLRDLESPNGPAENFNEMLHEAMEARRLVPVQDGTFKTPTEAQRIHGNFDNLLDGDEFHDISLYTDDTSLENLLSEIGVDHIGYNDFRRRLERRVDDLSVENRAVLVARLIENDLVESDNPPQVLIDSDGETVSTEQTTFLPPQDTTVSLPSWIPRHILHPKFANELRSQLDVTSVRGLRDRLDAFGVQPYDLASLVQAVVAAANDRVRSNPNAEREWRMKSLDALWRLYEAGAESVSLSNVTIDVPTRAGGFAKASSLYMTAEYPNGELVERLYGFEGPEAFVVDPDSLEFCNETAALESFLQWLGVAVEPRTMRRDLTGGAFYDHVLETLDYPARFKSIERKSPEEIRSTKKKRLRNVECIDRLEGVLEHASPYAILTWLARAGETLDVWRQEYDPNASLDLLPKRHSTWKSLRNQTLPSHPLWLLRTTAWLPVADERDTFRAPRNCSTASLAENLSPLVGYPAIDPEDPFFDRFGVDQTAVTTTLQKVGVTNTLADLSWDAFYEILAELPERDPDGELARRVYRTLLENRDGSPPASRREEFVKHGTLFGTDDGVADYYPVSELRYTNTDSIPTPVEQRYPTLHLDNRQGTEKVLEYFGVPGLTSADIDISDVNEERHPSAPNFNVDVEALKPFVYAYRVDADDTGREARMIRETDVILCTAVSAIASVDDDTFDIELEPGSYLLDGETAYVIPDSSAGRPHLDNDHLARLVGDIFSDILDRKLGKDILSLATAADRERRLEVLLDDTSAEGRLQKARTRLTDVSASEPKNKFSAPDVTDAMDRARDDEPSEGEGSDAERPANESESPEESPSPSTVSASDESVAGISSQREGLETIEPREDSVRRASGASGARSVSASYDLPDAKGAERIAYWFEQDEGRYPMLVSHLQGSGSYGCDVLSFDTAERREAFGADPDRELIDRYIEVKSSTSKRGGVTLGHNQVEQAITHRERFYLYRVYDGSSAGEPYELVLLQNPLDHGEAVTQKATIRPHYTDAAARYSIDLVTEDE